MHALCLGFDLLGLAALGLCHLGRLGLGLFSLGLLNLGLLNGSSLSSLGLGGIAILHNSGGAGRRDGLDLGAVKVVTNSLELRSLVGALLILALDLEPPGGLGAGLLELLAGHLVPRHLFEAAVGALEEVLMDALLGYNLALEDVAKQQVVVHGLGDDLGGALLVKLDKGKVLAGARLLVARQAQAGNGAKLRKVLAHLVLVETVGDTANVDDAGLAAGGLACGVANSLGDAGDLADVLALLEKRHIVGLVVARIKFGSENQHILILLLVICGLGGLLGGLLDGLSNLLLAVRFGGLFLGFCGLQSRLGRGSNLGGLGLLCGSRRSFFGSYSSASLEEWSTSRGELDKLPLRLPLVAGFSTLGAGLEGSGAAINN